MSGKRNKWLRRQQQQQQQPDVPNNAVDHYVRNWCVVFVAGFGALGLLMYDGCLGGGVKFQFSFIKWMVYALVFVVDACQRWIVHPLALDVASVLKVTIAAEVGVCWLWAMRTVWREEGNDGQGDTDEGTDNVS